MVRQRRHKPLKRKMRKRRTRQARTSRRQHYCARAERPKFTQQDKATLREGDAECDYCCPSYRDSGLATLRYTFADAVELKAELERQGYLFRMIPSTEATADSNPAGSGESEGLSWTELRRQR